MFDNILPFEIQVYQSADFDFVTNTSLKLSLFQEKSCNV